MTERNFNVAHNEELTPSVQPVKTFSGASHKTLARYVNDTESTMPKSLDVSIACQRFQLAGIIVLADGENFSSVDVTATAYKNHENRKYQLASETISLPATNAGNMGYVAATMSGYEDFVDSIAFSGTITIAAGGSVTIIALFKGGEDSALSELVSKIDEIADNTAIQQPYRLLEVDSNGQLRNNTTTKKKIDISGATNAQAYVLAFAYANNTGIEGSIDLSSLTTVSGAGAFESAFRACTKLTSVDLSNLNSITSASAFHFAFYGCTDLTSFNLPSLTTVSGQNACEGMFGGCNSLTTAEFPSLTTLSGNNALQSMFNSCSKLEIVRFPSLTTVSGQNAFYYVFQQSTRLSAVYFNSLTTTSFGSLTNPFNAMLTSTSNVKLHFPSNLAATISGLSGYPNFGGTNTQLLFDLPATE